MDIFDRDQLDGMEMADQSRVEKTTLRIPADLAREMRERAAEWNVPQWQALERIVNERHQKKNAAPILQNVIETDDSDDDDDDYDDDSDEDAQKDLEGTWNKLDSLHNKTVVIEGRIDEIKSLQSTLMTTLKDGTIAVTKATKNFSELGEKAGDALTTLGKIERKFDDQYNIQKKDTELYLAATRSEIIRAVGDERRDHLERTEKRLAAATNLIDRASEIEKTFATYFTEGVAQFTPEVAALKGSIERDLKKIKIFHSLSYIVGGLVFMVGVAAATYYRPALDAWNKNEVEAAATKTLTVAYAKQLADAEAKSKKLEATIDRMKEAETQAREDMQSEANENAKKEIEKYRIKAFEKEAQKFQASIEDANRAIGWYKTKLAEQCHSFCWGSYSHD